MPLAQVTTAVSPLESGAAFRHCRNATHGKAGTRNPPVLVGEQRRLSENYTCSPQTKGDPRHKSTSSVKPGSHLHVHPLFQSTDNAESELVLHLKYFCKLKTAFKYKTPPHPEKPETCYQDDGFISYPNGI